jgi:hypothetical protein
MAEALVPPKPMEEIHANHAQGHSLKYKMSGAVLSSTKSKCKIGMRKMKETKLQQKNRSWPVFHKK